MNNNCIKNAQKDSSKIGDYKGGAKWGPSERKIETKVGNKGSLRGENIRQEKLCLRAKRAKQSALRL